MTSRMPANFGAWEHLIRIIALFHNWRVRDFFRAARYDEHILDGRIDRPVNNIMQACIIRKNDSAIVVLVRIVFFEISLGNARRMQPDLYGIPVETWDEYTFNNRPEIFLYFEEDVSQENDGFSKVRAEIKFRLMDETPETITRTTVTSLANKIKAAFGAIPAWDFTKGKDIWTYQRKKEGYWLQIYANSETDAETLVKKVLSIQGHTFDNDYFKLSSPKKQSDSTPGSTTIMGKVVKRRRYRPIKKVRFRYATLNVPGIEPIVLYDPYYRLNKPDILN